MSPKFAVVLVFFPGVLTDFTQTEYNITFERMALVRNNQDYVKNFSIVTFKYNRTTAVLNATFIFVKEIKNSAEVVVQAYKFLSNEYRLFPMRFQFNYCHAATVNDYGLAGFHDCGNFSRCPLKKGGFHICNWQPDGTRFPPLIPNGSYMFDLQVMVSNVEIFVLRCYATIFRIIPYH